MEFLRAIMALISIPVIFFGLIAFQVKSGSTYLLLIIGSLMLAFAYDAFRKPYFFVVPLFAIFIAFLFGPGSKGISSLFGICVGIAVGDRCVKNYYRKKTTVISRAE